MTASRVWVIDDDPGIRYVLEEYLGAQGISVQTFETGQALMGAFATTSSEGLPDLVMADIRLEGESGIDVMQKIRADHPELPVIIMTAYSDLKAAVGAFQGGAFEFLAKPFDLDEVGRLIDKATTNGTPMPDTQESAIGLIGRSSAFQELIRILGRLSKTDVPVLITGETGSGKELVARALHQHSPRADGPFVAINMAAIPDDLLESELFGHERGAFTGADEKRIGRFEQAAHGTLFLDEIGDMNLRLQTRLLRVLAEGEYYRLGGRDLMKAKARIITATNQDLESLVQTGQFRADLYHRLKVISVTVPPLRERKEDIPELVTHFLDDASKTFQVAKKKVDKALLMHLRQLEWPGNIRELRNLCQSLAVLAPASLLQIDDLPPEYRGDPSVSSKSLPTLSWRQALQTTFHQTSQTEALFDGFKRQFELAMAQAALEQSGGNQSKAAKLLGVSRNTLARFLNQDLVE